MNTPDSLTSKDKNIIIKNWENLETSQKEILSKIWKVLTYKWQFQILLNTPFLIYWLLDKQIDAVHQFNLNLLDRLNLPDWLLSIIGFAN
tara:strand:- start:414 stop:683 length:270 start_codon:yes stop_codon:yes gene_type:complete